MKKFSRSWIRSKQPRKQRKYRYNAPLHIKHKFLAAHLSKDLIKKYKRRSLHIKKGDTVKVLRGQFKKHIGKVEKVITKLTKVHIAGAEITKKDGSKSPYPIHPSNLLVTELNMQDKERQKILARGKQNG